MAASSPSFIQSLHGLSPRLYRALTWLGVAELLALLAGAVLVSFAVDRWLELPFLIRLAALLGTAYLFARLISRARRRLKQPLTLRDLVAAVETYNPQLDGHLAGALELPGECQRVRAAGRTGLEVELLERALAESQKAAAGARMEGALAVQPLWRWSALSALLVGVFLLGALSFPRAFSLWFQRNVFLSSVHWPRQTHFLLEHEGTEWHQARNDPLEIAAWVTGKIPRKVELHLETGGKTRTVRLDTGAVGYLPGKLMERLRQTLRPDLENEGGLGWSASSIPHDGGDGASDPFDSVEGRRIVYVFSALTEPLEFQLRGGDNRSSRVRIVLHERPRIISTRLTFRFPDYLGREAETVENPAGEITVPAGTEVAIVARADQELGGGWARFGSELERPEGLAAPGAGGGDTVEHRFTPALNGFLDLAVRDRQWNLESQPPLRFGFLVLPDQEPAIQFELAGEGRIMTPTGKLAYRVAAEDDHGISVLHLDSVARAADDSRPEEELETARRDLAGTEEKTETGIAVRTEGEIDLAALRLASGSTLTLQAFASDNDGLAGPKTVASQKETITIVDPEAFRTEMEKLRLEAQARIEALARREEMVATLLKGEAGAPREADLPAAAGEKREGEAPAELSSRQGEAPAGPKREGEASAAAGEKREGEAPGELSSRQGEAPAGPRPEKALARESADAKPSPTAGRPQEPSTSKSTAESTPAGSRNLAERLAEEQAGAAEEAAKVADNLRRMAEALRQNQLLQPPEERRLKDEVTAPLDELAGERLPRSSQDLQAISEAEKKGQRGADVEPRERAQKDAETMAKELKDVAKRLAGGGDFREILGRLELIIGLQREVIQATEKGATK